jgi:hypothetical protein
VNVKRTFACLIVFTALSAAGCSNSADATSPTLPSVPTSPLVTENFSGTVQVGSSDSKPFTVTSSGFQITVDLTSAGPPATISMGLGVGAWDGTNCSNVTGGTYQAGPTAQLSGTIPSGQYCLIVQDVGNQSAPITYTAVVLHY